MAAGLQVFGQPASTDVARVLTCLFEKKLEFELVRIDTFKTHHKLPEFIRLRVRHLHQFFPCLISILNQVQGHIYSICHLQDPNGQVTFKHGDKTLVGKYTCIHISL